MKTLSATEARKSLSSLVDGVAESHAPIRITGKLNCVVLVPEEDWRAATGQPMALPGAAAPEHADGIGTDIDFARIQSLAHVGNWRWDLVNDTVSWSKELYLIFGVDPATFVPSNAAAHQLIHPDDRRLHGELVAIALAGKRVPPFESRIIRPGGEERVVLASGFDVEFDASGKATVLVGAVVDITARKRAEEELQKANQSLEERVRERTRHLEATLESLTREVEERARAEKQLKLSEDRYRKVVEDQTEIICRFNADGTFAFVNEVYCRIFGKSADELVGNKWQPLAFTDDVPMIERQLRTLSASNPVVVIENRVYTASGELRWMQFVNRGFFDEEGRMVETQAVGRDITERKMAEEALRQSEERFRTIFHEGHLGACIVGLDRRFQQVNRRFCEMVGYTPEELLRLTIMDITIPEDRAASAANLQLLLEGKASHFSIDKRYRHKNGGIVWGTVTVWLMRDQHDEPLQIIGTVEDISEKRKLQEQRVLNAKRDERAKSRKAILDYQERLRSLAAKLSQAQEEERRRLATQIHDEIGQNLAFCKMKIGQLRETRQEETACFSEVIATIDRCITTTRSLSFELSPAVLYEVGLEAALQWLSRLYATRHGLRVLVTDRTSGAIPVHVRIILFQATREFLANAAKHSGASATEVMITGTKRSVSVTVRDDGRGFIVPEDHRMPPFNHGFGLFNVLERLTNAGGSLSIESTPGVGTTVKAAVPLKTPSRRRR